MKSKKARRKYKRKKRATKNIKKKFVALFDLEIRKVLEKNDTRTS